MLVFSFISGLQFKWTSLDICSVLAEKMLFHFGEGPPGGPKSVQMERVELDSSARFYF